MTYSVARRPHRRVTVLNTVSITAILALVALCGGIAAIPRPPAPARVAAPAPRPSELIAAVGDIACAPTNKSYRGGEGTRAGCREKAVADLLAGQDLAAFLPLGDLQYENGRPEEFAQVYDQFFGRFNPITKPIPGNHEYNVVDGYGYYGYFGPAAHRDNPFGAAAAGSYSYNLGSWHLIALNSNMCMTIKPCTDTHPLMRWLKDDLDKHREKCTLAYWHHPLWSAGKHGSYAPMAPVWNALLDAGADLVLVGHDHNYQRFAPLGRATAKDANSMAPPVVVPESQGMRQFVVGTGGANNYEFEPDEKRPDLAGAVETKYTNESVALFGALLLRLDEGSYRWTFAQVDTPDGSRYSDAGTGTCR